MGTIKDVIASRQSTNIEILNALYQIVQSNPDLRFRQILSNLNLDNDGFYEESVTTLEKVISNPMYNK